MFYLPFIQQEFKFTALICSYLPSNVCEGRCSYFFCHHCSDLFLDQITKWLESLKSLFKREYSIIHHVEGLRIPKLKIRLRLESYYFSLKNHNKSSWGNTLIQYYCKMQLYEDVLLHGSLSTCLDSSQNTLMLSHISLVIHTLIQYYYNRLLQRSDLLNSLFRFLEVLVWNTWEHLLSFPFWGKHARDIYKILSLLNFR